MQARVSAGVVLALWLSAFAVFWATQVRGLVSSNDGSNVALARALARGDACLGADGSLTLWVDHARVGELDCSDRPPGAAMAAVPAVLVARPLDARWFAQSRERLRRAARGTPATASLVVRPATPPFITTYGARRLRDPGQSVDLLALQGTAVLVGMHCITLGIAGLWMLWRWMDRLGLHVGAKSVAVLTLGAGSLWGPYATALFSHETAGVCLLGAVLAFSHEPGPHQGTTWRAVLGGFALGWACITDYTLVLVAVPFVWAAVPRCAWGGVALGLSLPLGLAAAYHHAAFGAWWRIGYDFQSNFSFARGRVSTFSGDPWLGFWTLWGWGRGAGVAAQAPIVLVGAVALFASPMRKWAWIWVPWLVLLVFHQTPWGGAGEDHRYLIPSLPFWALGVGWLWERAGQRRQSTAWGLRIGISALFLVSCVLTWHHFWSWRGGG